MKGNADNLCCCLKMTSHLHSFWTSLLHYSVLPFGMWGWHLVMQATKQMQHLLFFSSLSRLGNVFHGGICESELGPFWRTGIRDILHNRCWFSLPHALYYQHLVMLCWLPHFQGKLYAPYNNSNVSINPYSATITCVILTLLYAYVGHSSFYSRDSWSKSRRNCLGKDKDT